MQQPCRNCGETHAFSVVAPGDLERSFDFAVEWRGLRLLCPGCGALQRVSFGQVALTNRPAEAAPAGYRIHAVVGPGPEIVPFPRASGPVHGHR